MIPAEPVAEGFGFHIPAVPAAAAIKLDRYRGGEPDCAPQLIPSSVHSSCCARVLRTPVLRLDVLQTPYTQIYLIARPRYRCRKALAEEERYMINGVLTASVPLRGIMTPAKAKLAGWMRISA